jgi:hypothetical protein
MKYKNLMKYSDLFQGQPITCTIWWTKVIGKISIDDGRVFICQDEKAGHDVVAKLGYKYTWYWLNKDQDPCDINAVTDWSFGPRTLKDMVVGDILVSKYHEAKVLEVGKTSFLMSNWDKFDEAGYWNAFTEAENDGWKFKDQPEPEDSIEIEGEKYSVSEIKRLLKKE